MTDEPKDGMPDVNAGVPRQRRRTADAAVLGELLRALGDESHAQHLTAVKTLIRMGPSVVSEVARTVTPDRPWLGVYHALDVLFELGDGRGAAAMLRALRHPNANVRWNAVRGLGKLGDPRGLLALRGVARRDNGRTSWGESVSVAAREVLSRYGRQPLVHWGRELLLTALALGVLVFAVGVVQQLLDDVEGELQVFGRQDAGIDVPTLVLPTVTPRPTRAATSVPTAAATPVVTAEVTGSVTQTANVRSGPGTDNAPVGQVVTGERVVLTARSADGQWLLIRLLNPTAGTSQIGSADGSGWVSRRLMADVAGDEQGLPVVTP